MEGIAIGTIRKLSSAIHIHFMHWMRSGLAEYDEMEEIASDWQRVDKAMVKALLAQVADG